MKKLLESIAIYAIRKILGYFIRKYNLTGYIDAIQHLSSKLDKSSVQNKSVSYSKSTPTPPKSIVEPLKKTLLTEIIKKEGGYVNHPSDRGGETKFGITIKTARGHGYIGEMRDLPLSKALEIYDESYWKINRLDDILILSLPLAREIFDTGVNMGPGKAGIFLQRSINALTEFHLKLDGAIGDKTINALKYYFVQRGDEGNMILLSTINGLQTVEYLKIVEKRPSQKVFFYGWIKNRVAI